MGLFDRFTKKQPANFADGTARTRIPTGGANEVGVIGESIIGGFGEEEARQDKLTVNDYVKMRQNDGTIASLYMILTLPISAATLSIVADEDDANEEQADFIRKNLLEPPHKGGMEIPLPLVISDMLRGVLEGFRVFEKVYKLDENGKIVLRKLASRDSQTVFLKRADDGGYGGLHQRTNFKGKYIDVEIPAWKTFLYTYGKDKNFLYGESAFKAAYYHYDKKHKLYYLEALSIQTGAVPPKVLKGPANYSTTERDKAMKMVNQLGGVRTAAYIPDEMTLEAYNGATGRISGMSLIEHHDTQMARSVLAQFLMLGGTQGSKGGSFALSKDHSDILMVALKAVMQGIEDHLNFYLIPDLIDLNFATPAYPRVRFEEITSDTKDLLVAAFTQLVTSGKISDAMSTAIQDRVAETLDIDLEAAEEQLEEEAEDKAAETAAGDGTDAEGAGDAGDQGNMPMDKMMSGDNKPVNQSDPGAGVDPKASTDNSRQLRSALAFQDLRSSSIL